MRLVSAAALQFFLATTAALRGSSSTGIGRSRSSSIGSSSIPFVGRRSSTRPSSSYGVVVVAAAASKSSHSALYASSCDTNNNNNLISNRPQCRRQSTLSLLASPQNKNQRKTNAACRSSILRGGSSATSSFPSSSSSSLLSTTTTTPDTTTTSMTEATPVEIFRTDYQPLPVTVRTVRMEFQLHDDTTLVTTRMTLQKNPPVMMDTLATSSSTTTTTTTSIGGDWVLDGDETSVTLQSIALNGRALVLNVDYTLGPGRLVVPAAVLDAAFADHTTKDTTTGTVELETVVALVPQENTQLSGLYLSDGMYCTQCEAMGFRRITYYPDRPDNMAVFESVRIEADQTLYPLLLSNGNLIEQGMVAAADSNDDSSSAPSASSSSSSNRHYAVWSDPYPKPSYLFAVVAGNLGLLQDTFTTSPSGRTVTLRLYSEPQNVHKLHYAMQSLQRAMQWDQDRFGLEYDLDLYNIVAVDNFNMGAMENKSLNVFNTAYVLADEATATDSDFERVEAVIGHEYFHNWTGNRVTCRDWFQLTLKEGLTVFRDQEFSGDMGSKAVKRIEDVRSLRARQFNEDAGPMSHPIRPESYISMDNFYTGTVYIKGAEIIRMYQTILSKEGFRRGMDLYFQRHDGSAVTCDDFLSAMADANGVDLSQFARWYSTAGTPTITYESAYNDGAFSLTLTQSSNSKEGPLHIPISIGLLDKKTGKEVLPTTVLNLKEEKQTFSFDGLEGDVVLSLLRGFSAPVKAAPASGIVDEESMAFLAARDTDGFLRWEAGQNLYMSLIFQTLKNEVFEMTEQYVSQAFERALTDTETTDYSIQAYTLILPTESTLAEEMTIIDPIGLHKARGEVKKKLARKFEMEIREKYESLTRSMEQEGGEFKVDAGAVGRRRLRNVLLEYLCSIRDTDNEQVAAANLAEAHFEKADGMTDKMAGLTALASMDGKGASARNKAMEQFYNDAKGDSLVLNKWFSVQATANLPDVLARVKQLKDSHPDFTLRNPNRCRSLIGAYASNAAAFHDEEGESYKFMGEVLLELDALNPQISSRLAGNLIQWRKYDEVRGAKMKSELEKLASKKLSDDLYEIVTRGLK